MGSFLIPDTGAAPGSSDHELRELKAAKDAEAKQFWFNDDWRVAQAAVLSSTIFEGFETENLLDLLADVEYVNEEDRITIEEIRGLKVFFVSEGGQIDESSLTDRRWELQQDFIGFHLVELIRKLRSGFTRRSDQIVELAIKQMVASVNRRLWGCYQLAIPSSGSPFYAQANGLSLPQLDAAINEIQDIAQVDTVSIIGRGVMVKQIQSELRDQGLFLPETNEAMVRRGLLGSYNGANIVKLTNYLDSDGNSTIPGNEIFVAAPGAAKVGFWGGTYGEEFNEQGGFYWHHMGRRTFGMAVHRPEWVRRIVDTSRNA